MMKQSIPVILGPTASGKTAYAIALARTMNAAIISADSRQIYAGMNIGTAKPKEAWTTSPHDIFTPDTIEGVPHYLLNIASINTHYTLSHWLQDAKTVLSHLTQPVIIVGGTMLYIDALTDGYELPEIEPNEALRTELSALPASTLYARVLAQDPHAQEFIEPHNTRRMIRALEVMHATGKPFSSLRVKTSSEYTFHKIGLFDSWDALEARVASRAQAMMNEGLMEERARLAEQYPDSPLLKTVNYVEDSTEKMAQSNMRYAHRQMSWWKRKQDIGWICV